VLTFEKLDMPLDLTSDGDEMSERGVGGTGEFTILELWKFLHDPLPELVHTRVESEIHGRLVRTLSVLVIPFLAIALGLASPPPPPPASYGTGRLSPTDLISLRAAARPGLGE